MNEPLSEVIRIRVTPSHAARLGEAAALSGLSLATHYYADQADDYYSRDGGAASWQGEGAKRMGAVGQIDPARFKAMLQGDFGRGIAAGRSIRKDAKARAALDLTFGAPQGKWQVTGRTHRQPHHCQIPPRDSTPYRRRCPRPSPTRPRPADESDPTGRR